jgi:hypothetical protein
MYLYFNEFMWISVKLYESIWIKTNYLNIKELTSMYTGFSSFLFQIIWFFPNLYKFIQIYFEFIWKYAHSQTAALCRIPGQPYTAAHTTAHCRTQPRALPYTATLPHTACIKMSHTAHRTVAHRTHLHTPQLIWIQIIFYEYIFIYMILCEFLWIYMHA